MRLQRSLVLGGLVLAGSLGASYLQTPAIRSMDERALREYAGVYQWGPQAFVYLQLWNEFADHQLVAFDESGEIRALYPTGDDQFFVGPGAGISSSVEARVTFRRDAARRIVSLTWAGEGAAGRTADRVEIEHQDPVRFVNGTVTLAGTLIRPRTRGPHPAIILVHYSGAANRESVLPFVRFLVREGVAVLGYDKRGVGESTGDWTTASFDDLASDVIAAFSYLKGHPDIDATQIGLFGISQAGWIMPLAAVNAPGLAFLISVSGAGVSAAETGIDHARNEMTASGMPQAAVDQVTRLMQLQYDYARTGQGWEEYNALRGMLVAKMGSAPANFPGTQDDPYWAFVRGTLLYDPVPTIRQLRVPVLAIFGALDNNILAAKNAAAWRGALEAGGHPDFTLTILPGANHYQFDAVRGTNGEMASLRRFVPAYAPTVRQWLTSRLRDRASSVGSSSAR